MSFLTDEPGLKLSDDEKKLIVNGLLGLRREMKDSDVPVFEINDLILKVIDSQKNKDRWRDDREER